MALLQYPPERLPSPKQQVDQKETDLCVVIRMMSVIWNAKEHSRSDGTGSPYFKVDIVLEKDKILSHQFTDFQYPLV